MRIVLAGEATGSGVDAFITADVGDQLIVIVVAVAAVHRLDVAAELLAELVDECDRLVRPAEAAGDPFVPAGDEDERRIELERAAIAPDNCGRAARRRPKCHSTLS